MRLANHKVIVVDYAKLTALDRRLCKRRGPASKRGYKIWARYDDAIRKVMRRYRKVGSDDGVDFYHGGDWFHELYDGFALKTTTALSARLLRDLQEIVAQHHPDAVLDLGGDIDTPMFGLRVLVAPTGIRAAWYKNKAVTCRRKLKTAGVKIL